MCNVFLSSCYQNYCVNEFHLARSNVLRAFTLLFLSFTSPLREEDLDHGRLASTPYISKVALEQCQMWMIVDSLLTGVLVIKCLIHVKTLHNVN